MRMILVVQAALFNSGMEEIDKIKEDLIKQRDLINSQIAAISPNTVVFSVDANIINRLGRELVGRAETAVSELVKNAYDADATLVRLDFIESLGTGGMLTIEDDGHGMTKNELVKGFMTLSSPSKIHEPLSPKFNRHRAGKKGIGRFATQFLGEKLTIITQVEADEHATKVEINWNSYIIDRELSSIENSVETVVKQKPNGTTLYIETLRHAWTDTQIRRVFRYVTDLLQPTFLSELSSDLNIAQQGDTFFLVECYRTQNNIKSMLADINKILFEKALAEIEGYVNNEQKGFFRVKCSSFNIDDKSTPISAGEKGDSSIQQYRLLKNIHFKVYYFIYDRHQYYSNGITKLELNNVESLANTSSGIRVYRNGFRVLPYGELGDDWLSLDRNRSRIDIELEDRKSPFNIPYTNKNFFGFVEIVDKEGELFEETASREGLIESEAISELKDFTRKAIIAGIRRLSPYVYQEKQKRDKTIVENSKNIKEKLTAVQLKIEQLTKANNLDNTKNNNPNENGNFKVHELNELFSEINNDFKDILDELAMLRILASLGITIGEFTHEIIQFPIFFNSKLKSALLFETDESKRINLEQVLDKVHHLDTYVTYFNDAVSKNARRNLELIELRRVIIPFVESTKWDFDHEGILVEVEINGYDLFTVPMHPSEWHSILLNLYTNSKKALRRGRPKTKKIKITASKDNKNVFLDFSDNGDGVPKEYENRIFDAFFTTSTPVGINANLNDQMVGSGLGLKILKDLVLEYKGDIYLAAPPNGYNTCFRIEIPKASDDQIAILEN